MDDSGPGEHLAVKGAHSPAARELSPPKQGFVGVGLVGGYGLE